MTTCVHVTAQIRVCHILSRRLAVQESQYSQHMGAVDLEANGLLRDALVVAHSALCLIQDLLPDPVKVVEALACRQTISSS